MANILIYTDCHPSNFHSTEYHSPESHSAEWLSAECEGTMDDEGNKTIDSDTFKVNFFSKTAKQKTNLNFFPQISISL